MAHAAKPAAASADMRLQHRFDPLAQRQIRVPDDPGGDLWLPVSSAVAHRGDAGHEFRFAHRTHLRGPAGAVHRMALQEHGADDVVPAAQVREQFVQQVTMVGTLPQVMMRINNGQSRIKNRFRRCLASHTSSGG